jgi:predicted DNA-binding transcriptional regulator YafY
MATNKNAIIRYQALDRCFRNKWRKYYFYDLLEACNERLRSLDPTSPGIKRRQLYEDIKFMESDAGYQIELEKRKDGKEVYYRYSDPNFSINNRGLNESEASQIREALITLSRFRGMPQFEWIDEAITKFEVRFDLIKGAGKIIGFDENKDYTASKYISKLFNSILHEQVVKITYKGFKQKQAIDITFHPYYLKQFNNRWFCFGLSHDTKQISNLALDRILNILDAKNKYVKNEDLDFDEYFEDVIGVTVQGKTQRVVLKVDKDLWPYIETKPLHGTQRIKSKEQNEVTISIDVKPNYELESLLLSHAEKIEIIEPVTLKQTILDRARKIK